MSQKAVLVTGSSSGIGLDAARTLKERGYRVFAGVRNPDDMSRLSNEGLEPVHLDYTNPYSIQRCAAHVLTATNENLYGLFNNGAIAQLGAVEDLRLELLREQFEVGFFGWHDLTIRLLPYMRARGEGRIINCSSVLGLAPMGLRGAYTSTKYAVEALSETMRIELAGTGVYVSLIEPGPIRTNFLQASRIRFLDTIDIHNSPYRKQYQRRLKALEDGGNLKWKLGPEAVTKQLVKALESNKPAVRYYVTVPTYFLSAMKRVLGNGMFHKMLVYLSRSN
jgi:NAD(P)-dependent dehydrogenase (short-subunit alcohol dehydrogenase family)